jgi:ubiquinone/menaquinone biosynthesis C-methylase UbiE
MTVFQALAAGASVAEREFDLIFPKDARKFSRAEWTPLAAAIRAASLLVARPGVMVLVVGWGAGLVWLGGPATTAGRFTGIDLEGELVAIAKGVSQRFKLQRLKFLCGDALALDWEAYDGLYFFNPFANSAADEGAFVATIQRVTAKLSALPSGRRIVTYHGFGGQMPPGFVQELAEVIGPGVLQLWVKR